VSPRGARTIRISGTRERLGRDPYRADLSGGRGTPRETPVALVQGGSVRHRGRDGVGVCTVNPPLPTRPLADSHARAKSERCSSRVLRRARAPLTRSALKSPNGTAAAERRGDCTHLFVSPRRGQAGRGGERAAARLAPPCEEHRPTRHRCHTVPGSSALSFALSLSLSLSLAVLCTREHFGLSRGSHSCRNNTSYRYTTKQPAHRLRATTVTRASDSIPPSPACPRARGCETGNGGSRRRDMRATLCSMLIGQSPFAATFRPFEKYLSRQIVREEGCVPCCIRKGQWIFVKDERKDTPRGCLRSCQLGITRHTRDIIIELINLHSIFPVSPGNGHRLDEFALVVPRDTAILAELSPPFKVGIAKLQIRRCAIEWCLPAA